jgi:hypothetical protein
MMKPIKSFFRLAWISSSIVLFVTLSTIISTTAASVKISWSSNDLPSEGYRVFARRSGQFFDDGILDGIDAVAICQNGRQTTGTGGNHGMWRDRQRNA